MFKKSVSLIMVLVMSIHGISRISFAGAIAKNVQTMSSESVGSMESQTFITKGKMISEQEVNQYNQLQEQAIQNSMLNHHGGFDAGEVVIYILAALIIVAAVGYAEMY